MATICYVADPMGGSVFRGGPSFSQLDALAALLSTGHKTAVLTSLRTTLPGWYDRYRLPSPVWLEVPRQSRSSLLHDVDCSPSPIPDLKSVAKRWLVARRLRHLHPDVLWVEDPHSHRFAEEARDWRVPHRVMMLRGSPMQFTGELRGGPSELERVLAEMSAYDALACVSERVMTLWQQLPSLGAKKWFCLPNCAREEAAELLRARPRALVRRELGIQEQTLAIVCPASVQFRKGQDLLVGQMPDVLSEVPSAHLYMVGIIASGMQGDDVVRQVKTLGLDRAVSFTGHQADSLSWIYAADVVVLPSREEAMPLAMLEAMVLGTPIVGSNVCGIPELIEDGTSGLLFDISQPQNIGRHLSALGKDPSLREHFALAARQRYFSRFSRQHQMTRYAEAIGALLGGR